jgi:acylphosphatase
MVFHLYFLLTKRGGNMKVSVLILTAVLSLSIVTSAQQTTQEKKKKSQTTQQSKADKKDVSPRTKESKSSLMHYKITVTGEVQNVGFRNATKQKARSLDLKGTVRNDVDGTVYIEAEGPKEKLDELVAFCKEGPSEASVSHVKVEKSSKLQNFKEFDVDRVNKGATPGETKPDEEPRE